MDEDAGGMHAKAIGATKPGVVLSQHGLSTVSSGLKSVAPPASPPGDCIAVSKDGTVLKKVLEAAATQDNPPPFARCLGE